MTQMIEFSCYGDPSGSDQIEFKCDSNDRQAPLEINMYSSDNTIYLNTINIKQLAEFFITHAEELGLNED